MADKFTEIDDMSLVKKSMDGDIAAFEMLFNRYQKYIYNLVHRMVGNEQDANDLTMEVFVCVYNSIGTIRTDWSFSAWIRTVTINICRDFFRKQKRNVKTSSYDVGIETEDGVMERQLEDWTNNPQDVFEKNELNRIVADAILSLPPQHREVIILHHIDGQEVPDIANELNIPVGTVKSRLARARDELKRKLAPYLER